MTFKEFIHEAHCENGVPSSKRLYGGIAVMAVQLCLIAGVVLAFVCHAEITGMLKELLEVDLITGASLLGLNSVTKIFQTTTNKEKGSQS